MTFECPHVNVSQADVYADEPHDIHESEKLSGYLEEIYQCPACYGVIRYCKFCRHPNRVTAFYCTKCGEELDAPQLGEAALAKPGEINQNIKGNNTRRSLEICLPHADNHYFFMWFGGVEGLFVLTKSRISVDTPLNLYFIPGYRIDKQNSAKLLFDHLPPYTKWLQAPLLSRQGLFFIYEDGLHYFPSHGYEPIFTHRYWPTPERHSLLAITVTPDNGHPVLLLQDQQNQKILLYSGNTQAGEWGVRENERILLDGLTKNEKQLSRDKTGYVIGLDKAAPTECWIYNGQKLAVVNLQSDEVRYIPLKEVLLPPHLPYTKKADEQIFRPFMFRTHNNSPLFFVCQRMQSDAKRQVGIFEVNHSSRQSVGPEKIAELSVNDWITPDPWGQGFVIWSHEGVEYYDGKRPAAHISSERDREQNTARGARKIRGGNFALVPPLLTPHWFTALTHAPEVRDMPIEILILSTEQINDRHHVKLISRERLAVKSTDKNVPTAVSAHKIPGMPPLYAQGRLFIALHEGKGDEKTAPVKVYIINITC